MALIKNVLVTVKGKTAKVDTPIYLYLGDGNLTLNIKILEKTFSVGTYNSLSNVVVDFGARYASVCLLKPNKELINGGKGDIVNGRIRFEITKEFVDQITEAGTHLLLIHLYDSDDVNANRYTIPPIAFEVLEPICDHGGMTALKARIDSAGVDVSKISSDISGAYNTNITPIGTTDNPIQLDSSVNNGLISTKAINTSLPVFGADGKYIMTDWETGEIISEARMDKIERGIYGTKEAIPTKTSELTNDNNFVTETQVDTKIANAQLGGGTVDLSNYATKTDLNNGLATKVNVEAGKSLVSDTEIARLANIDNYDDTQVKADIALKANTSDVNSALALKADKTELHDHDNKTVLDGITADKVTNWDKAEENVQADWNVTITTDDAYIKNKPTIPSKTSELTNDSDFADKAYVDEKIADAVTGGTVDLTGYVKKTELATETLTVTTTNKTIPGAINELDSDIGDKTTLTTTEKANIVGAVNELDSEIGDLTTLETTDKNTIVDAINELYDDKVNVSDIIDNLTSTDTDKPLSANQGKVIVDEWLGGKKLIYLTQVEYDALSEIEKADTTKVYNVTDAVDTSHTHDNKDILDGITETNIDNWNDKIDSPDVDGTEGQILSLNASGNTVWINNTFANDELATDPEVDAMLTAVGI